MSLEQSVTALEQRNAELVSEVVRARDAVMGLSNMYTTITLGLAGTEDGQYFTVPGNGAYQKLYQHDGSQAPLIATYPSNSDLTDALTTLNTAMSDHVALPDPHDQYAEIAGQTFTGDIAAPKITASTGILFGTDTAAANTLDDYEEGTWTPDLQFGTSVVYTTQLGTYTKIGNFVNVIFEIDVASRGDDMSGVHIGSLPFIPEVGPFSNGDTKGPGSLDLRNTNFLDLTNGALLGNMGASNNTLRVHDINGASLSYTSCEASGIVTGAISYQST